MEEINLTNKPLIEAIFEFRWELEKKSEDAPPFDPFYKLIIGQIFDKLKTDYPYYNALPSSSLPDEIAPYVVQHQFRKGENEWPLIQLGPGVLTLNETNNYTWQDFYKRIEQMLNTFYDLYPKASENLKPKGILLRYIDAIVFDHSKENLFGFLREKLKTRIEITNDLFRNTGVTEHPTELDLKIAFKSIRPNGAVRLRFAQGKKNGTNALIWETQILSTEDALPDNREGIFKWALDAHQLIHDWFFKLIEGDLLEELK